MHRISLVVVILSLLAVDPTLALAMGAGGGAGAGGAGAGGASAGGAGAGSGGSAGNGASIIVKPQVVTPAGDAKSKDSLLVQSRDPRSLDRPGRQ